jgi:uracil-DNA glycosylase family 4
MQSKAPGALCSQCPFKDRAVAHSTGPADADIVVVSRSPGYYEALNGKCFSGPSGKVLDHLLNLQGVDRSTVRATNVVLCQSDGSEGGFGLAQGCCAPRLALETEQASTIIACGREASQAFTGSPVVSINRGYVHVVEEQRIIVTNNPAVVLRDDSSYPELVRDFRLAINPIPEPKLPSVKFTDQLDQAKQWVEQILAAFVPGTLVASDIETSHGKLTCAGFAIRPEKAVVFGHKICEDENFVLNHLSQLWEEPGVDYLWHNGKYDVKVLRRIGIDARVDEDTMLLSWCLDERPGDPESGAGGHSLEWLLKDLLGWPKYEPSSVAQFKKTGVLEHKRDLYDYNGMDTAGTLALFDVLKREAIADNVYEQPYRSLLIDLSETLTRMELEGVAFDSDKAMDILEAEVWPKLAELRQKARKISKKETLNLNSHTQLKALMYDEWELSHKLTRPRVERKGKISVDQHVRREILEGRFTVNPTKIHPKTAEQFTRYFDDFKTLETQRNTFFEALVKKAHRGRVYTDFKIHGTESGRLSSSKPNLQNVTRPKEGMPSVRSCFLPDPGCVLISADLSQAELRTIAVLSGDRALQSVYTDTDRSLHKEVAAEFYGENYTYEQYVRAKNINFGVAYWQSAFSFAQLYAMPIEEAQKFIDMWWERFPQVWEWTKATEKEVMELGEIQSPFGHKRRFYVIPSDESGRLHIVKEGINFRPQNIAANITLWGLCEFARQVDWRIAQPRLTIHDSILVNCKEGEKDSVAYLLKECLENAPKQAIKWDFPYLAEISIGYQNWGTLDAYSSIRQERPADIRMDTTRATRAVSTP